MLTQYENIDFVDTFACFNAIQSLIYTFLHVFDLPQNKKYMFPLDMKSLATILHTKRDALSTYLKETHMSP